MEDNTSRSDNSVFVRSGSFDKKMVNSLKIIYSNLKEGQKYFTEDIAAVVNTFLLTIVYFIGVGLTSIFAKISRKRFLDYGIKDTNTYWKKIELPKNKLEDCYRQF